MAIERARIEIRGVVQGVGFRPFIYRVALAHGLVGWVINTSGSVDVEAQGPRSAVEAFLAEVKSTLPPLARIDRFDVDWVPVAPASRFEIRASQAQPGRYQLVPPDIATCDECRADLFAPDNRRFSYAFTNCTNCGPRFTIIADVPYDRPMTTMADFPLCEPCRAEYQDPMNRRFHAQPNACGSCGPHLWLAGADGGRLEVADVVVECAHRVLAGEIAAPKGLGGFHLACDATNPAAVARLRDRKKRPGKPLAVMVANVQEVERYCCLTPAEAALLASPAAPIVLLQRRSAAPSAVAPNVAPGQEFLGVMLPYTPFHHLLIAAVGRPLVMTSANCSEEPIATGNREAVERLGDIADFFVMHNRTILNRCDDSVAMVQGTTRILRRSRGYAPDPIPLGQPGAQVVAYGAHEKNTICLTQDTQGFLSHHIGDLENAETLAAFEAVEAHYGRLFRIEPVALAHDLHPDYLSTRHALAVGRARGLPTIGVQHHHAHIVACMAEHGHPGPVIGLAFDGTGLGTDQTIWGGELLHCTARDCRRLGGIEPVPMAGGTAAILRPTRMACCHLLATMGRSVDDASVRGLPGLRDGEAELVERLIARGVNAPRTSSMGRLFDAVAAILGLRGEVQFDAQAAIDLEMAAHASTARPLVPFPIEFGGEAGCQLMLGPLLEGLERARNGAEETCDIAWRFHVTLAHAALALAQRAREITGIATVAASGGVFQNRLLLRLVEDQFSGSGLHLLTHSRVPCNDGGIALGQAVIARARLTLGDA